MGEPQQEKLHRYASVADWVQTTSLAQYDETASEPALEDSDPDAFYRPAIHPPTEHEASPYSDNMTTTRQRQQSSNGNVRATPKPAFRSASGPATSSTTAPRSAPQLPGGRPSVKAMAQKFNQAPSSADSSPSVPRVRPTRVTPSVRSTTSPPVRHIGHAHPPTRPAKEASYGPHKFSNLKTRERPQPAPASPAGVRRANGVKSSLDDKPSPSRTKVTSPVRTHKQPTSSHRAPFFGEVVGEHDAATPGYGIPTVDPASHESDPSVPQQVGNSTIKLVPDDSTLGPMPEFAASSPARHMRSPSDMSERSAKDGFGGRLSALSNSREPRRYSPPSRIPVASRRMSAASDSSSSIGTSRRANKASSNTTPGRRRKVPGYNTTGPVPTNSQDAAMAALAYKELMTSGRSPKDLIAAGVEYQSPTKSKFRSPTRPVIPLPSPRLRHSNERHFPHHGSPELGSGSVDHHTDTGAGSAGGHLPVQSKADEQPVEAFGKVDNDSMNHTTASVRLVQSTYEHEYPHDPLTVKTSNLHVPHEPEPVSAATEFEYEESPVLGMPGSFMMTPPLVQSTPQLGSAQVENGQPQDEPVYVAQPELLQARVFHPPSREMKETPPAAVQQQPNPSEFSVRESIPIMLGEDDQQPGWGVSPTRSRQSPRLNIGAQKWRAQPMDTSVSMQYQEEDSPIDPFANRGTLRPDDSASMAFYHQFQPPPMPEPSYMPNRNVDSRLTMDSHAYSVINKVLNLYHESESVTPEMATDSQLQVLNVSPAIAQHKDWGSKEATETYLARLLSDATPSEKAHTEQETPTAQEESTKTRTQGMPSLSIDQFDEEPSDFEAGGTAIIFPSESRRYSRGSGGSSNTMIWEDGSRPDSNSDSASRDPTALGNNGAHMEPISAPHPPPKDERHSPLPDSFYRLGDQPWASSEHSEAPYSSLLPQIESTGEGLGLHLQASDKDKPFGDSHPPPRPPYSPPPPPAPPSIEQTSAQPTGTLGTLGALSPSIYGQRPPSSHHPSAQTKSADSSPVPPTMGSQQGKFKRRPTSGADEVAPRAPPVRPAPPTPQPSAGANPPLDPAAARLRQRYNIIRELIETEKTYAADMMVADSIFQETAGEIMDEKARRTLFSNTHEIACFSNILWRDLKRTARPVINIIPKPDAAPKNNSDETLDQVTPINAADLPDDGEHLNLTPENDRKVAVGAIMNEAMSRIERLYTTYLLNHEDANVYIKANLKNPKILGWVMACILHSKGLTQAWDLDSLLIKPTQRILKYPLLLGELLRATDEGHPDYEALKVAHGEVKKVCERIDDAKKRQQTLREATREGRKQKSKGLFDTRLGKNFVKALTSKADKAKLQAGTNEVFEDPEYDKLAQKFGGHFFQLQIVLRDVEKYIEDISVYMVNLNATVLGFIAMLDSAPSSSPEIESAWRRQAMALYELQTIALEDHITAVRIRVIKPIVEVWGLHNRPQKLMEQRKKGLTSHVKFKQALERKEKIDTKLQDASDQFLTVNNALKIELPKLYSLTKSLVLTALGAFVMYQKDWWRNCQKKILPLLEYEPEHTTSLPYDLEQYVARFRSDHSSVQNAMSSLAMVNRSLLSDVTSLLSPTPTLYSDDTSSRKSSSRRTESMSSDISTDTRRRRSGGYVSQSFDGQRTPGKRAYPAREMHREYSDSAVPRTERALSPISDKSDDTIRAGRALPNLDGAFDDYNPPAMAMAESAYLAPTSNPGSSRASTVFSSALPMSDSPTQAGSGEGAGVGPDSEDVEVLFLAASLFEFNIAHDRREGGIPYLVYVPGEIFDVIGLKGELWLARNQDDPSKTIGWIWEKHFARILPEES